MSVNSGTKLMPAWVFVFLDACKYSAHTEEEQTANDSEAVRRSKIHKASVMNGILITT